MFHSKINLAIRFMIGFMLGIATVQVLAQTFDYSDFDELSSPWGDGLPEQRREEQGVYERMYPDVDSDGYNWDTNEYQDIEILHNYGEEQDVYNWDTHEYQTITPNW